MPGFGQSHGIARHNFIRTTPIAPAVTRTISFVNGATGINGSAFSIGGLGIAAGDLCVIWNASVSNGTAIADNIPTGFTRVGTTQNFAGSGFVNRENVSYRILDGTETTISNLMSDVEDDISALIFRPSGGTWGSPQSVVFNIEAGTGTVTDAVTLASGGTAPLFVTGGFRLSAFNTGNFITSAPAATALQYDGQALGSSYTIYNIAPVDVTISASAGSAGIQGFKGAFYIPLGP